MCARPTCSGTACECLHRCFLSLTAVCVQRCSVSDVLDQLVPSCRGRLHHTKQHTRMYERERIANQNVAILLSSLSFRARTEEIKLRTSTRRARFLLFEGSEPDQSSRTVHCERCSRSVLGQQIGQISSRTCVNTITLRIVSHLSIYKPTGLSLPSDESAVAIQTASDQGRSADGLCLPQIGMRNSRGTQNDFEADRSRF